MPAPSLSKPELAQTIAAALGDHIVSHGDIEDVPFLVRVYGVLPLAIFAFTISDPPGGREPDELKIQLIAPGQSRGERGNFNAPDEDTYAVLLGYSPKYAAFVLWDAYRHRDFSWSKNCQVRLGPIQQALISGIGYRDRTLGNGETEHIIVARPDHLATALGERVRHF